MRDLKWKKVKEEHIVQDQWIDFRRCRYQFPNGEEFEPYYNYSRRSYSVIVARDENGDFICVQQYRHGLDKVTTEFPAGGIEAADNEYSKIKREDAFDCARRELDV